jgi:thiamine-phosphate pyrophosphorylase
MFPQIYPLTDIALSGLSHAEQVERLCDGGATLIQLREKNLPTLEFYRQAGDALTVARQHGARVIVNDRVDIALALGADGVHLGQNDFPPEAARRLLGEQVIIGFSTHNADQARQAVKLPVNYIAIGPIFSTRTKADPSPEVGLDGLRAVRQIVGALPLIAIGGITEFNAQRVIEAGADAVALVSALLADPNQIADRTRLLFRSLSS